MGILRAALCLSLLGSPGCAQLFGIESTSGNDGGASDASPTSVTMQVQRISEGPVPVRTPYDVSTYPANFLVADSSPAGFHRVAARAAGDTWSAELSTGTPAMEVTLGMDIPDQFRRLYALPQRNIKLLYGIYEQPDAVPAPATGTITATLRLNTPAVVSDRYRLYCVGSWAYRDMAFSDMATTVSESAVPYSIPPWGNLSGRPLTKITTSDTMLGLKYSATGQLLAAAEFPAFDQTAGDVAISATLTPFAAPAMDVHISPAALASRLAMPAPTATSGVAMAWNTNASPGWDIANAAGPQLNAAGVLTTDSGAITAPTGNPFVSKGWRTTFNLQSNKSRTYAIPQLANRVATFYTGINAVAELSAGLTVDPPAALPVLVSINTKPLTTDGQTVTIDPATSVVLTMVTDTANPTFYQYNIYELREDAAATALETHVAYVVLSDKATVTIPSDAFTVGKTYWIRAHTISGGFPSFASGNLWDRDLPYSVGFLDAGVFTVVAP
jgi:hypothetical protein